VLLLTTLAAFAWSAPSPAADWLGTVSNDWFTAGNWSPAGVPTAGTDVSIDTTVANPAVVNAPGAEAQYLGVGHFGAGMLNILNGGSLSTSFGIIGYIPGLSGTVIVDGENSAWINSELNVGFFGTGTLTIRNGGVVSAETGRIASAAGSTRDPSACAAAAAARSVAPCRQGAAAVRTRHSDFPH
jgi:T5SS/PEP-CTERM-associated repeat protein